MINENNICVGDIASMQYFIDELRKINNSNNEVEVQGMNIDGTKIQFKPFTSDQEAERNAFIINDNLHLHLFYDMSEQAMFDYEKFTKNNRFYYYKDDSVPFDYIGHKFVNNALTVNNKVIENGDYAYFIDVTKINWLTYYEKFRARCNTYIDIVWYLHNSKNLSSYDKTKSIIKSINDAYTLEDICHRFYRSC
jgi:hypothetical protein